MNIIINYNDDTLIIEQDKQSTTIDLKKLSPLKLKNILEEIFNRVEWITAKGIINISLQVIDEDTSRTVDEW